MTSVNFYNFNQLKLPQTLFTVLHKYSSYNTHTAIFYKYLADFKYF